MARVSPSKLDAYTSDIVNLYRSLDTEIFLLLTRELRQGGATSIAQWHANALQKQNMINDEVIEALALVSGEAESLIRNALEDAGRSAVNQIDKELAGLLGMANKSRGTTRLMRAYMNQTFLDINNFVNQTLITTQFGPGVVARMYQDIVSKTTASFITGGLTFDQALERTVLSWVDKGVRSVFIDRGNNPWSIERYVETVLRSTINRTYNELRMGRMRDYGVYTALVTTLMDAAPRCIEIQGRVVDTRPMGQAVSGYPSIEVFGYGRPDGPFGINCRHQKIPFIPGVSENNQPIYDKKETVEKSEVRDKVRTLERGIRQNKKRLIIQEELNSPNVQRTKNAIARQSQELQKTIDGANWLSRDPARERVIIPRANIIRDAALIN